jgi:hypothetical protein
MALHSIQDIFGLENSKFKACLMDIRHTETREIADETHTSCDQPKGRRCQRDEVDLGWIAGIAVC